jgi:hypothetical protein
MLSQERAILTWSTNPVSDIQPTTVASRPTRESRPDIALPDGETLQPRVKFCREIGITEKTATRWDLPTTYIGGCAYVTRNASLKILAGRVRRRHQPTKRKGYQTNAQRHK